MERHALRVDQPTNQPTNERKRDNTMEPITDQEREEMRRTHRNVATPSMFDAPELDRLAMMRRDDKTGTPSLFTF